MTAAPVILLVDDSRVSRMLCGAIVRERRPDAILVEAGNGDEALSCIATLVPHLAVLDVNMPGMSGLELAERIRNDHPDMRIALLTANVQDSVRQRAAALNAAFFAKPINDTVVGRILDLLESHP
ncbi:MAG TPA: response regulator [Rhodocyclaceae bacterium]|nr:response regulator [Rhodocyclaceae bacterium]HMV62467.1 response regulator [Rhodocyclaceae bacterium]HNA67216.1 response regulator [Rhodocyclaceae bacterium]HNB64082.1 response regulator [Rhodocyclaceae bacterium]HNE15285.1 response regulator [Rhodocyclaceae bacterium]